MAKCSLALAHEPYVLMQRTRSRRLLLPEIATALTPVSFSPFTPSGAVPPIPGQLQSIVRSRIVTLSVGKLPSEAKDATPQVIPARLPTSWIVVEYMPSPAITHP